MKNLFHVILVATPLAALILFFALSGKEEIKNEQHLQEATGQLKDQQFEDQFSDAWNGEPGSQIKKQRAENVAELKAQVKKAQQKRDGLDQMFDDATQDMKDAINDEDTRLGGAKASKSSKVSPFANDDDERLNGSPSPSVKAGGL